MLCRLHDDQRAGSFLKQRISMALQIGNAACVLGTMSDRDAFEEIFFLKVSDIMDLRHQSSAMCIIMLGGEDTHPWSATKKGNPIPATIPVDQ